eukprot:GEMP01009292.1.p1 GENE.GEMP01009292.1~~GEMP01009292.1.p1  ORF type:complete len:1109 (+),score=214.31 GEMP01009292.1:329-3328(+)
MASYPTVGIEHLSSSPTLTSLGERRNSPPQSLEQVSDSLYHATPPQQAPSNDTTPPSSLKDADDNLSRPGVLPKPSSSTGNARTAMRKIVAQTSQNADQLTQANIGKRGVMQKPSANVSVAAAVKGKPAYPARARRVPSAHAATVSKLQAKTKARSIMSIAKTRAQKSPQQYARGISKAGHIAVYSGEIRALPSSASSASSAHAVAHNVVVADGSPARGGLTFESTALVPEHQHGALQPHRADVSSGLTSNVSNRVVPVQEQHSSSAQRSDSSTSVSPLSQTLTDRQSSFVKRSTRRASSLPLSEQGRGQSFSRSGSQKTLRAKQDSTTTSRLDAARVIASCFRCLRVRLQFDQYRRDAIALRNAQLLQEMHVNAAMLETSCATLRDFLSSHVRPRMKWLGIRRALMLFRRVIARTPVVRRKRVLEDQPWLLNTIGEARMFTRDERHRAVLFNNTWFGAGGYVPVSVQVCKENLRAAFPRGYVKPLRDLALRGDRLAEVNFSFSTCVCLTKSGMVYCFGSNLQSECGTQNRALIVSPGLPLHFNLHKVRIVKIATGAAHVLALSDAGAVFAWGRNALGSCGIGCSTDKLVDKPRQVIFRIARQTLATKDRIPVDPREIEVVSISCGKRSGAAITRSDGIWLWGVRKSVPFPRLRITDHSDETILVWGVKSSTNSSQQDKSEFSEKPPWQTDTARVTLQYTRLSERPSTLATSYLRFPDSQLSRMMHYDSDIKAKHLFEPIEVVVMSISHRSDGYSPDGPRFNVRHKHLSVTALTQRVEWILELYKVPRFKEMYTMNHGIAWITPSGRIYASGQVNGLRNPDLEARGTVYRLPQLRIRTPIRSIAISSRHCVALAESGTVFCWGMIEFFSIKASEYCDQAVPTIVPVMHPLFHHASIASIHCSMFHCAVRFFDKRVFAWHFADWTGAFFCPALFQYCLAPTAERICYAGETFNAFFADFDKPAEVDLARNNKYLKKLSPARKRGDVPPFTPSRRTNNPRH